MKIAVEDSVGVAVSISLNSLKAPTQRACRGCPEFRSQARLCYWFRGGRFGVGVGVGVSSLTRSGLSLLVFR
ncbi:hypothetical protein E2C01_013669 [Portunus trituberculatus]|uniref:Uncharacterized protein n=1 Tax=Portunus trituberculatus TaxID=210409 RepID=A0A5B7DHN1_PORTR|nr:hypothetical protein [Portunus trituberculatus]